MRILLLNANYRGVGTYHRALGIGKVLADRGHEVDLATLARAKIRQSQNYESGVRVMEHPSLGHTFLPGWGSGPIDIFQRIRMLLTQHYDVVYGFEYQPDIRLPAWVGRRQGIRFFNDWCDLHGGAANRMRDIKWLQAIDARLERSIRLHAEVISVISTELFNKCIHLGIPETRLLLVREGVDVDRIPPVSIAEARRKTGFSPKLPIVGYAKDASSRAIALRIFRRIKDAVPNAILVLIGNQDTDLEEEANTLGLQGSIRNAGWVPEESISAWMGTPNVWILPLEDNEANRHRWPHKVGEFFAAGRPVVLSRVGDIAPFVTTSGAGLVSPPGDEGDMSRRTIDLLIDQRKAAKMGEMGINTVRAKLLWEKTTARLVEAIEKA